MASAANAIRSEAPDEPLVLVVDDEESTLSALRVVLEPHFQVLTADRGERGLEVLDRVAVDAVMLDLNMPGIGGIETLSRIRERDPDLEVIVVTGFGSYDSAADALRLHACDWITKPFESARLLDSVRRATESHRARLRKRYADLKLLAVDLVDRLDRMETAAVSISQDEETSLARIRELAGRLADELAKR